MKAITSICENKVRTIHYSNSREVWVEVFKQLISIKKRKILNDTVEFYLVLQELPVLKHGSLLKTNDISWQLVIASAYSKL